MLTGEKTLKTTPHQVEAQQSPQNGKQGYLHMIRSKIMNGMCDAIKIITYFLLL